MIHMAMLASTIGQIFQPLYELLAWIMAFFYAVIPNFAVAIALLTVAVMIVTAPLTVKSTRSTIAMQRLAPELKKVQQKYKGDKVTLNEEMMKLYKEHNINPAGGCLPMLIQLPVFVVLYGVIRGLTNTVKKGNRIIAEPRYISKHTHLYHDLLAAQGHMKAFGLDLAGTLFSHHSHWYGAIPYGALVLVAIALQYLQMRQLNSRNPAAAQANPQMQMMQRYMPLIFAIIYLRIAAGVNVYFIVSSLCRIGIQEAIFRSGVLDKARKGREGVLPSRGSGGGGAPRRTIMERLADAQQRALEQQKLRQADLQADIDAPRNPKALEPGNRPPGQRPPTQKPGSQKPGTQKPAAGTDGRAPGASGADEGAEPEGPKPGTRKPAGQGPAASKAGPAPNGAGGGKPTSGPRPTRSGANGSANGSNTKASGNGSPAEKPQPQGQPRSAKKRPRKAR